MSRNRAALEHASRTGVSYQAALSAIRSANPFRARRATVVIACASRKGGEGKTVITANLAAALAQDGARVLAIDCDPQQFLRQFLARRQTPQPLSRSTPWTPVDSPVGSGRLAVAEAPIDGSELRDQIRGLRNALRAARGQFDLVLLDSPPGPHADLVASEADALLVPIHSVGRIWTERIPDEHDPMFDWLNSAFDDWLDEHDEEEDPPVAATPEEYDAWYEAQRGAFLASVDATAAAMWSGSWPQQIPAWIQLDEEPASTAMTTEEIIAEIERRVPIGRRSLRSAAADHARPHLLGLVQNCVQPGAVGNSADEVRALLAATGVPVFRRWISRSDAIGANSEPAPVVLSEPQAPASQQFHQLAAELRQRLSTWRP